MSSFRRTWLPALLLMTVMGAVRASDPAAPTLTPTPAPDCVEHEETAGKISARATRLKDRCVISVNQVDAAPFSRSYVISSNGLLMVFNNLGEGKISRTTGARAYFLFPRKQAPSFEVNSMGFLAIRLPNGQLLRFSPDTGRIEGMTGADVKEDPEVNARNAGGVELRHTAGIVMDCGWQLGEVAYSKSRNHCTLIDAQGATCAVGNTELFDYTGDPRLKFTTDSELAAFLRKRCPRLDDTPLLPRLPAAPAPVTAPAAPAPVTAPEAPASTPDAPASGQSVSPAR